jgi:hypothetical protein
VNTPHSKGAILHRATTEKKKKKKKKKNYFFSPSVKCVHTAKISPFVRVSKFYAPIHNNNNNNNNFLKFFFKKNIIGLNTFWRYLRSKSPSSRKSAKEHSKASLSIS